MNVPNRQQILALYRSLLRYGQELKFSDKNYYNRRIKGEFKKNKELTDQEEIERVFQKGHQFLCLRRLV